MYKALAIVSICIAGLANSPCEDPQDLVVRVSIGIAKNGELSSSRVLIGERVVSENAHQIVMSMQQQIEYRDRCLGGGPPEQRSVEREFVKVRSRYKEEYGASVVSSEIDESVTSTLEGVRLAFHWDPKLEKYKVAVRGESEIGDLPRLQEVIRPSVSASFLNPNNASKISGQWKIPTEALRDLLLAPGGDLFAFTAEPTSQGQKFATRQQKAYLESLVGGVHATIIPAEAGQVASQARVSLTGELSSTFSVLIDESSAATRKTKESVKLSGSAVWNKNMDRLESISLDAVGERHNLDDILVTVPSGTVDGKLDSVVKVKIHWELRCTYEPASQEK